MNVFLSHPEALKLFAKVDTDGDGEISVDEFEACFKQLQLHLVLVVLEDMGVTKETLAFGFLYGVVTLLLLFGFIFVGIAAFTQADGFSSVINSLMPVLSGAALGASGAEVQKSIAGLDTQVRSVIKRMAG